MRLSLRSLERQFLALYHTGNLEISLRPGTFCYKEVKRLLDSRRTAFELREALRLCEPV